MFSDLNEAQPFLLYPFYFGFLINISSSCNTLLRKVTYSIDSENNSVITPFIVLRIPLRHDVMKRQIELIAKPPSCGVMLFSRFMEKYSLYKSLSITFTPKQFNKIYPKKPLSVYWVILCLIEPEC